VLKATIKPINGSEKIFYIFSGSIDLPENIDPGITTYNVTSIIVNGIPKDIPAAYITKEKNHLHHRFSIELHHENEYDLIIKREKILSKKRNPDKRAFAPYIIKDAKISVIVDIGMDVDFHKMGTINDFFKISGAY
jgi:hypothetical protein